MPTWLDTQPAAIIRRALDAGTDRTDDDQRRFGLWLELVDLHLDQLRAERSGLEWDWQGAYEDGWSPRTAAFAAWARHLQPISPAGEVA
jgi:hypothetical protein